RDFHVTGVQTCALPISASRHNPGVLWTHNDSDVDGPQVYAFAAADARYLGRWRLGGAAVRDWEDMAIGPGKDGGDALYVGDFGEIGRASCRERVSTAAG